MLVLALVMASHSNSGKRKAKPLEQKKSKCVGLIWLAIIPTNHSSTLRRIIQVQHQRYQFVLRFN